MGINNAIYKVVFLLSFCCWSVFTTAQEKEIETIDGKQYYVHEVKKGSTLYSISKFYHVSSEDIVEANPFLAQGLQPGQNLRIPVEKVILPQQDSLNVPNGYILHEVVPKETLYSLSKQYNVTVRELLKDNPLLINGLKLGQKILIKPVEQQTEEQPIIDPEKFIVHEVQQGETLYSLSKSYGVNADSIIARNNGLVEGLKSGMSIIIPKEKPAEIIIVKEVLSNSDTLLLNDSLRGDVFNVALMLPFYLDMNDTLEAKKKNFEKDKVFGPSKIALQFYQGALLAVDSMRKAGLSVKLYVYDTANDTTTVKNILERPEVDSVDLFIGPLFKKNFLLVAEKAKQNNVPIVSPVPQSNKVLLGNPNVSKVAASRIVQVEKMAEFAVTHYLQDNIYIFNNYEHRDIKLVDKFHSTVNRMIAEMPNPVKDSIQEVYFSSIKASKLEVLLDSTQHNVIVIPSNDNAFVSEFLTQLNLLTESYNITVLGLDKWKNFENIPTTYFHSLNVHITSTHVMDFNSVDEVEFALRYRNKYHTDPNQYGFLGFDVCYYYFGALLNFGKELSSQLPLFKHKGVSVAFDFKSSGLESGLENQNTYILKFADYQLKEVQ